MTRDTLVARVRTAIQSVPFTAAGDANWDEMAEAAVSVFDGPDPVCEPCYRCGWS